MKVHLIRKQTIENFAVVNPGSRSPLAEWFAKLKYADWQKPADIQATFRSADLLGGNNYRMICNYLFGENQVYLFICWIGTHAGYDKICMNNEQYTVSEY